MAIEVTENWSGLSQSLRPPWTATKEYVVTGAPSQAAALLAVPYQLNDGHPYNTRRMKCQGPFVKEMKGPDFIVIVCPFAVPEGGRYPAQTDDPLLLPPRIWWEPCEIGQPVDHDLSNRVICNSASDILRDSRRITYKRLIIEKNLPFYDFNFFDPFENTVNNADVALSATVTALKEHMRCTTIGPAIGGFAPDVEFMPMRFVFDIMRKNALGAYPWQHRLLDAGRNGFYSKSGVKTPGQFVIQGDVVDFDVKLDGTGIPLTQPYTDGAASIKVGGALAGSNTPTTPPHPMTFYAREYYDNNGNIQPAMIPGVTAAVWNYFEACKAVDFTPLLQLL